MSDPTQSQNTEPQPQIDQEAVAAFLAGIGPKSPPQGGGIGEDMPRVPKVTTNLGPMSEEAEAYVRSTAQAPQEDSGGSSIETPPEEDARIETDVSPLTDPSSASLHSARVWAHSDSVLGEIKVSDHEKALYIKSLPNNATLYWDIVLGDPDSKDMKMEAKVRSLSHYEVDVIYRAARKQGDDGFIYKDEQGNLDMLQLLSWIQWYSACLQVVSVNGVGMGHLAFPSGDLSRTEEDADKIREHYKSKHMETQAPLWGFMLAAMRVFETKLKICNDGLANGNFWKPALGG